MTKSGFDTEEPLDAGFLFSPLFWRSDKHHGEVIEVEYCGLHDPVAVKAKRDAERAKWKAEREARDAAAAEKKRQTDLRNDALDALKQIATGHNDPRALALEILAKHGEAA